MDLVENGIRDGVDTLAVAWAGQMLVERRVVDLILEGRTQSIPSAISCRLQAKYTTEPGHINGG
jgi:hypothetical protein